jgi:tryptophan synthase alpha chain
MKNNIQNTFLRLKKENKKALISFITAGDPDLKTTEKIIYQLVDSGVDIIELGVPFSDPMADGPVIQLSSERALKHHTSLKDILDLVKKVRKKISTPIVLMGYLNPIYAYGYEKFAKDASKAGVNGVLIVDLPIEESKDLVSTLKKNYLDFIFLISPVTTLDRKKKIVSKASGFIYYVSMTGITGAKLNQLTDVKKQVLEIKKQGQLPVAVGFGINSKEQAKRISQFSDGIVIGSAIVKIIADSKKSDLLSEIDQFISPIRKVLG